MKYLKFLLLLIPLNVYAYSPYIIASGKNIGIEVNMPGILVTGVYKINGTYPSLETGDLIISIDDSEVKTVSDMITKINSSTSDIKVGYIRDNITKYTNLKIYKDGNFNKTGLYVKDKIAGVGTLTYIDPKTNIFGALGHEIDSFKIADGKIYNGNVEGILKSEVGNPGEVRSSYKGEIGKVKENTIHGIFGSISDITDDMLYKVASPSEIKKGKAKMMTVLEGNLVKAYEINILKIDKKDSVKNILFEVTDDELLSKTGGIIQGMSGSPIIQDGNIIGAVTHVLTSSPQKGYGIFITNMLEEGEN